MRCTELPIRPLKRFEVQTEHEGVSRGLSRRAVRVYWWIEVPDAHIPAQSYGVRGSAWTISSAFRRMHEAERRLLPRAGRAPNLTVVGGEDVD